MSAGSRESFLRYRLSTRLFVDRIHRMAVWPTPQPQCRRWTSDHVSPSTPWDSLGRPSDTHLHCSRYTIHGGKEIDELELPHLDGHKGQKPVRIGNGAADHLQLDIYGELLDASKLFEALDGSTKQR